ncbi:unnamed protein product [Didymodactylos carnosus]|uniref:GOST seven transmembrane domain-containing protein n=1 Tax=Didymodactylos carnosus TaxID=1234261 RepID=A0A814Z8M9_9BILA|nr:unnamed protein product [Didymodactylos carnosus]CAF1240728.1 unnamed protein product [Didymodactylos carnosus]CAF3509773.1 unnamed protein product [Didymodactylos carnosus]CAF4003535.1 unnamed protein product [Didymodactylos carnosus]
MIASIIRHHSDWALIPMIAWGICELSIDVWIILSLRRTTLWLIETKNDEKLRLFRCFSWSIICIIIAMCLSMIWMMILHLHISCTIKYRFFWMDDAFGEILNSTLLIVLMIIFRPKQGELNLKSTVYFVHEIFDDDTAELVEPTATE